MNFLSKVFFKAPQNWEIARWLEDKPILYKSAMHYMELPVANLEIDTTTFTWTGMAKCNLMSCVCKSGARVQHKYSKMKMSIRIHPLNSLLLNDPNRIWSKNPDLCNPRSRAHKRRCSLPLNNLNPCNASIKQPNCCKCHSTIYSFSLDIHSREASKESWKIRKSLSFPTSGSIFCATLILNYATICARAYFVIF